MNGKQQYPISPQNIVEKNIRFRVPLYQRPYSWEEEQVQTLLNDLFSTFGMPKSDQYHIGILSVANSDSKKMKKASRLDLIDGQQRITTLTLIGKVAEKYCGSWKEFNITDRLELYGREHDKDFLENSENSLANPKLKKALEKVKEFFEKIASKDVCSAFSKFIFENAVFFLTNVPPGYSLKEKNQQFVRMNNRGKQLEKHEILKVKLLGVVKDETKRAKYFNIWNEMVKCLTGTGNGLDTTGGDKELSDILVSSQVKSNDAGDTDKESLYTSIINIPEFLLIALARHRKDSDISPNKDRLIISFDVMAEVEVEDFMTIFESQLNILRKFFVFYSKSYEYELGMDGDKNNEDGGLSYPEDTKKKDKIRLNLIAVQSYLYVSTEPHHWLIGAFDWCKKSATQKIDAEKFVIELERIDNDLIKSKKRKSLNTLPELVNLVYPNINHYWFYRLDYELWKRSKSDGDNTWDEFRTFPHKNKDALNLLDKFKFRKCGSVEHIIPQVSQNLIESKADHGFGNLALISSSSNSKFGNNNSEGKRGSILESGKTESLKMLHSLYSNKVTATQGVNMYQLLLGAVKSSLPSLEPEAEAVSPPYVKP